VRLALPEGFYRFVEFEGLSGMGEKLGEEEWVIKTSGAQIISGCNPSSAPATPRVAG
jgi:hypothetical protein